MWANIILKIQLLYYPNYCTVYTLYLMFCISKRTTLPFITSAFYPSYTYISIIVLSAVLSEK